MSDLISREALMKFPIRKDHYDRVNGSEKFVSGVEAVLEYAENLPAVDAEPVVRCKDCAFYIPWGDERKICGRVGAYYGNTKPDDFCSRSVRMDLEDAE